MADKDVKESGSGLKVKYKDLGGGAYAPYVSLETNAPSSSPATAASLANVASSATNVTLKAANASRRGLIVFNDADKALHLKYGATASATSFTVKIAAGGYWEMPQPVYVGVVDGIWEAAPTGSARVTEST